MKVQPLREVKGMSIVEILVSFFILVIIAVAILPSLVFGYKQVYDSGKKSAVVYSVQEEIEKEIVLTSDGTATIEIQFGTAIFSVKGSIIEKEEVYDAQGNKTKAKVFVPKK
ncbi:MAG: hypothetical protein GX144_06850 [Clostridiaceae bacterium]|nr:hypothetical protein [Clostridiaceae bacterium]